MSDFGADFLARRRAELAARASEGDVDAESVQRLPADEDQVAILLLASRLGLSLERALDPEAAVADLVAEGEQSRSRAEFTRDLLRAGPTTR
jgi:hypothetical protein